MAYLLLPPHYLLQEVHIGCVHGGQVGLAVLQEEVIQLLLGLHLGRQLINVHLLQLHLCYMTVNQGLLPYFQRYQKGGILRAKDMSLIIIILKINYYSIGNKYVTKFPIPLAGIG